MEVYRIGEIIREERLRQDITQEDLCFGICSIPTLSRIENSSQKPSLKIQEALLERLNYSTNNLNVYADDIELRKHKLEKEISARCASAEGMKQLLDEYEELIAVRDAGGKLERQLLQMYRIIESNLWENKEYDKIITGLIEALRYTIPEYTRENIKKYRLLTSAEITIFNNLAIAYAKKNNAEEALYILEYLFGLVDDRNDNIDSTGEGYNILAVNIAKILLEMKQYRKALVYTEKGICYCMRMKRMQGLPELLYYEGMSQFMLGNSKDGKKRYEQVIMLLELQNEEDGARAIRDELQKMKQ